MSLPRVPESVHGGTPGWIGVRNCGYQPICLKEIPTNDNICDLILSGLRKAQFVVSDFTKQKGGVYFESGFGKALGKEVFWTCRADDFHNLHFDTNHYGHISGQTRTTCASN